MDLAEKLAEFLAGDEGRFEFGVSTGPPTGDAILLVAAPSEALKLARDGTIEESVNRDLVWQVLGVSLAGEIVRTLGSTPRSVEDLVGAVNAAGRKWSVIEMTGGL